jgi:hypothetical protein
MSDEQDKAGLLTSRSSFNPPSRKNAVAYKEAIAKHVKGVFWTFLD